MTPERLADVRVGQMISYHIPVDDHHVQTHRVIAVVRRGGQTFVRTKGDANNARDPWLARLNGTTAWQVRAVVPKAGWGIVWLRSPRIRRLAVFGVPLLLALFGLWRIWRAPGGQAETMRHPMRRARSAEPKPLLRSVRWGAVVGSALAAFVVASGALAGFTSLATGGTQTIVTKHIFLGPRSLAAQDLRDASSGAETNKSDAYSYADGTVATTSTAIASGTNRYVELTMSGAEAGGLSVSGAQFNFRLASSGGAQAGNACFWLDVRSGGTVIGTHGSSRAPRAAAPAPR